MVEYKNVKGSYEASQPLIINIDTVYVHTNIRQATDPKTGELMENMYVYDEKQYTKDEYIGILSQQLTNLQALTLSMVQSGGAK